MKVFLVTVSSVCLCGILFCFLAYATGNFPISKTTPITPVAASQEQATLVQTDSLCSPCVERMALVMEMIQDWETGTTQLVGVPDSQLVASETKEECSPCEENMKRLKVAMERWERDAQEAVTASNTDNSP